MKHLSSLGSGAQSEPLGLSWRARLLRWAVAGGGYSFSANHAYGPDPRHCLDLYAPLGPSRDLRVLFLYGGGWRRGDKGLYPFVGQALASRGFATVVADYRLYPAVRFPAFVEDAGLALRWTSEHGSARPAPVVVMGHSAGAHTALLLAARPEFLDAAGVGSEVLAGAIGLAGPYAFDPLAYPSTEPIFAGIAGVDEARPLAHAGRIRAPVLLLHGAADRTVSPANSRELAARIRSRGGSVTHREYASLGHLGLILSLAVPFRWRAPALHDILTFLDSCARPTEKGGPSLEPTDGCWFPASRQCAPRNSAATRSAPSPSVSSRCQCPAGQG